MSGIVKSDGSITPNRGIQGASNNGVNSLNGVYTATVTNTKDSIYTGRIQVHIDEFGSSMSERWVLLCSPYGGITDYEDALKGNPHEYGEDGSSANGTVKSYGMWPQPPVPGSSVLVAFTSSSSTGFLLGTLMKKDRNHMMGGRASSMNTTGKLSPVGERNPYDGTTSPDARPEDKRMTAVLTEQGLNEDLVRGHSMSSPRRETPSNVFGISTLNGHVFTMDDGSPEDGDSRNIRLRTREGAQILLDDTNKMIFINNHKGNAWVEIDENGKIDVYSKDTISMHCEEDFNIHTKADFNVQADGAINMTARGSEGVKIDAATGDMELYTSKSFHQQAGIDGHVRCGGRYYETASRIDMNGPVAEAATRVQLNGQPANTNILASAATRVPEHHPWKGATKVQETFKDPKGKAT